MFQARACLLTFLCLLSPLIATAQPALPLVKVADGIYAAIQADPLARQVDGTSIVIVNEEDVVVVDANIGPASARAVLAEIRKLTDKPVRYLINTHWHDDHVFGNFVYRDAFPQVEIVAHANTRSDLLTRGAENLKGKTELYPSILADSEKKLAGGKNKDNQPYTEAERADLTGLIEMLRVVVPDLQATRLEPPTVTVDREMTLYRAKREIRILHLGRGNTQGDLAVYLPQDRVLLTGDLLVHPIPFAFGSHLGEWVQTLKKLRELNANVIVPGHGQIQKDKQYLDLVTSLLESVLQQTKDAAGKGLSLEETRKAVDLESFRTKFAGDDPARNKAFTEYFVTPAIERGYKEAKGELD
jgi:cyclase